MSEEPDDEPTMILMWDKLSPQYLDLIADTMGIPKGQLALTKMSKVFKKFADQMAYAKQYHQYASQMATQQFYSNQQLQQAKYAQQQAFYNQQYQQNLSNIQWAGCTVSNSTGTGFVLGGTNTVTSNNTAPQQQGILGGFLSKLGIT